MSNVVNNMSTGKSTENAPLEIADRNGKSLIFLLLRAIEGSVANHSCHCEAGTAGRGNLQDKNFILEITTSLRSS